MAGQLVHFEIAAGDTTRARAFWGALLGWEFQEFPAGTEYHMAQISETMGSAIYAADGDARGTRAYFDVDDIAAGREHVDELGGRAGDSMPVPGMGWFAICTDTEGNEFGLWQSDPGAAASE
jgi:predicted enzyme related to lactoylglutathione lyase